MDDMKTGTVVLYFIAAIMMLSCSALAIRACTVADHATFDKVDERIRRENFEETKSYRDGLRRDFDELLLSYAHAKSDDERATIRAVMRHRAEGAPPDLVPQDVKDLLQMK